MAWKRHLWSTDLMTLVTFLSLDDLIIFYFMSKVPTRKNWDLYLIPMCLKRHLWSADLFLATLYPAFDQLSGLEVSGHLAGSRNISILR